MYWRLVSLVLCQAVAAAMGWWLAPPAEEWQFTLAMALGEGAETRAPMAHAVIGGMVSSTVLTLIVTPVVYSYLEGVAAWWRGRKAKTRPA